MKTQLEGNLICLNCSRYLGTVRADGGRGVRVVPDPHRKPQAAPRRCGPAQICCGRCGGRAVVEDLHRITIAA